ncbi:hypothetical protein Cgig2_006979 [Carnegiea gigantea]|uniref:(S)-2-hydroxy-acid oxidase n=1 Tax=Carnegiea gigantea TaxID=171969 RepID=A0A9Q1QI33_9CARY|nr:hypothetical protein Cgig2_006979 [Carnegiea gigantea]
MATEPVNINEFQELARQALPKMYYDFFAGAAEDEHTLRENVKAFSQIIIRPRVLVDVNQIDMSISILGHLISAPILIAPTAFHKLAHPEGEIATAKAAAACKTIMVLSFSSTSSLEEVASSCDAVRNIPKYGNPSSYMPPFHEKVLKNREVAAWLVKRAEISGYKAIVVTVDTPRLGRREADIKNKMIVPQRKNLEGFMSTKVVTDKGSGLEAFAKRTFDSSLCWKISIQKLKILLSNVQLLAATKAAEVGVDGIIVSNHGARQLDYAPATISVLEEIVRAVGGKVPVLLDGGIRRGTDIFKALALGAQAVLVSPPISNCHSPGFVSSMLGSQDMPQGYQHSLDASAQNSMAGSWESFGPFAVGWPVVAEASAVVDSWAVEFQAAVVAAAVVVEEKAYCSCYPMAGLNFAQKKCSIVALNLPVTLLKNAGNGVAAVASWMVGSEEAIAAGAEVAAEGVVVGPLVLVSEPLTPLIRVPQTSARPGYSQEGASQGLAED